MEKKLSEIILPSFFDFWKARRKEYTFYVNKGGRNSAKSTHISIALIIDLIEFPINAIAIRKVDRTIQESCYEQLKEACIILGVEDRFHFHKSPLKITYKPRGNYIIFRGADDPAKMKSIKTSNFPIARAWIEELAEFKTAEEVQTITDSILRAELPDDITYKIFYSYNPPRRKQHWVNKKYETQFIPANTYVHHSTYLGNHHLSEQTLEEIESVKKDNLAKYRWVYLGEPTGGGIVPFDNLVFRRVTDEEVKAFDNIRQGIDWGYATDPVCFGRMHFDKTRKRLIFLDEFYGVKRSNTELFKFISERGYSSVSTIADSNEPKSIAEMTALGMRIRGAKKGEGSVEYGEKWLDNLTEIVIDPERTPNIAREFEGIDYQVDREGNQTARLEDKDNHSIDMTRYACEDDMGHSGFYSLAKRTL